MNIPTDPQHEVTQGACRALANYRRLLRDHSMTWEDQENLADVLEWVEECLILPQVTPVSLLQRASAWLGMVMAYLSIMV